MGCTFDCYSTTFNSRSYAITLLVIAWIVPLIFILTAYIRIIQYVRKSTVQNVPTMDMTCVQWGFQIPHFQMNDENEFSTCEDHKCLPHIRQRVWLQQFVLLFIYVSFNKANICLMIVKFYIEISFLKIFDWLSNI